MKAFSSWSEISPFINKNHGFLMPQYSSKKTLINQPNNTQHSTTRGTNSWVSPAENFDRFLVGKAKWKNRSSRSERRFSISCFGWRVEWHWCGSIGQGTSGFDVFRKRFCFNFWFGVMFLSGPTPQKREGVWFGNGWLISIVILFVIKSFRNQKCRYWALHGYFGGGVFQFSLI